MKQNNSHFLKTFRMIVGLPLLFLNTVSHRDQQCSND